jgi:hypothetical protein
LGLPQSQRIFEGDTLQVFETAQINMTAAVVKDDNLASISSVQLVYNNASLFTTNSVSLVPKQNVTRSNYLATLFALPSNVSIDLSLNWTLGTTYNFSLVVSDIEGQSYTFSFNVLISNSPPKITQFFVNGAIPAASYVNEHRLNFQAYVNMTDLETDSAFGDNRYNFTYRFNPTQANPFDGNSSIDNNTITRLYATDNITQVLNFTTATGSAMVGFNFTMDPALNFQDINLYQGWRFEIAFDLVSSPNIDLQLFNYTSASWQSIGTNILNGYSAGNNITLFFLDNPVFSSKIGNFFDNITNTLQMRIVSHTITTLPIDSIFMQFKVNRKVGGSDIYLKVLEPLANSTMLTLNQTGELDIKNNYDLDFDNGGNANRWAFNYSIAVDPRDTTIIGTWTFIVEVYDYGITPINGIQVEVNGTNALSTLNFVRNDKTRSFARASYEVNIGIDSSQMLSINNVFANSSGIIPAGNDLNLTMNMNDPNAASTYGIFNTTAFPDENNLALQDGSPWNKEYSPSLGWYTNASENYLNRPWRQIDRDNLYNNLILNQSAPISMRYNESGFSFQPLNNGSYPGNWSLVIPYNLNQKPWLNPVNITRMFVQAIVTTKNDLNIGTMSLFDAEIQVWNYSANQWVNPASWNDPNGIGSQLNSPNNNTLFHMDNYPFSNNSFYSAPWANQAGILNCIDQAHNNRMYLRLYVNLQVVQPPESLNVTIKYFKLTVEYNNSYTTKVQLVDSVSGDLITEYPMVQTASSSGLRQWSVTIPTSQSSGRNYHFRFWAQNGNSSHWFDAGQFQGQQDFVFFQNYVWIPFYNASLTLNQSYSFVDSPSSINFNVTGWNSQLSLNRYQNTFQFNGTIKWGSYNIDNLTSNNIILQLRQYHMTSQSQWITIFGNDILQDNGRLVWNSSTNAWYVNIIFTSNSISGDVSWRSGVWYYRLYVRSNETLTNATDWGVFRLENSQPQNIVLTYNDPSNTAYHRVIDPVGYSVSFLDLEADNSSVPTNIGTEFKVSMYITVRDRYLGNQIVKWNTSTPIYYDKNHASVSMNTFTFLSAFTFGKEVDISRNDYYNEVYMTISDNDIDWPETGTLRSISQNFTVLDVIPIASHPLISDHSNNQVYRNNTITIDMLVSDPDDRPTDVIPQFLNLTYNTDYTGDYNTLNLTSNFTMINDYEWQYTLWIDIHNKTGTWTFNTNFQDWDHNALSNGPLAYSFQVLNNLPKLDYLILQDLNTGQIAYGANITSFGTYRANDTIQATAYIHDVEDTYLDTTNYSVKSAQFDLIDPINLDTNQPTTYSNNNFVFGRTRNGSAGAFQGNPSSINRYYPTTFYKDNNYVSISNASLGGTPTQADILQSGDGKYHTLTYDYYSGFPTPYYYGGQVFYQFASLPTLYDLNNYAQNYNLTIVYKTDPGVLPNYTVSLYNYALNQWDIVGGPNCLQPTIGNFTTVMIPLNTVQLRANYITETSGNQLLVKINETVPINDLSGSPSQVKLYIDQIYLGYNSTRNNYYEIWTATTTLPAAKGDYAGNIEFDVRITDNDNGLGTDASNTFTIYDHPPQFVGTGFAVSIYSRNNGTFVSVPQSTNGLYYPYDIDDYPQIFLYINATDVDGQDIGVTTISYSMDVQISLQTETFNDQKAAADIQNGTNSYRILIDTKTLGSDVRSITITKIVVADADAGHCDGSKFQTTIQLSGLQYKIILHQNSIPGIPWPTIIIFISIIGAIGAVFFGFWFYRRYISYRKYLNKED